MKHMLNFHKEVYEQIESIENDIDQEEAKTRTDLRNETDLLRLMVMMPRT